MADDIKLRNIGQIADECIICILLRMDVAVVLYCGTFSQLLRTRVDVVSAAVRQDGEVVHGADQIVIRLRG